MTTVQAAIDRCKRHLASGWRAQITRLVGALDDSTDSVTLEHDGMGLAPGASICVGIERMYVFAWNPSNKTATVLRGADGSSPGAHDDNALVEVNHRMDSFTVSDAIFNEIRGWPQQLFTVQAQIVTVGIGTSWVEMQGSLVAYSLIEARGHPVPSLTETTLGSWTRYPIIPHSELVRAHPGADLFPDILGVSLGRVMDYDQEVRLLFASPFTVEPWTPEFDLVLDGGLAPSMLDIAPLGAAATLMLMYEGGRTDRAHQGESRIAEEVPPMYSVQLAQAWRRKADERIGTEASKLQALYPVRY